MGQRLNIEIVNGETPLANCYYHWSAYTTPALYLTHQIIDAYYESNSINGVKKAVELLEGTGGGINEAEKERVQKCPEKFGHIKFNDATSRNDGLIAVTEIGMEDTREWEEGRVTIDLDSETFNFDVAWFDTPEDYFEYSVNDEDDRKLENLPEFEYDLSAVPFEDVGCLLDFVRDHIYDYFRVKGEDLVIHWVY